MFFIVIGCISDRYIHSLYLFVCSKLSTCMGGLQAALLPFHWQHTLITVVPSNLISISDLCEAPTPYLIGLFKTKNNENSLLPQFTNKQQVRMILSFSSLDLVRADTELVFLIFNFFLFTFSLLPGTLFHLLVIIFKI